MESLRQSTYSASSRNLASSLAPPSFPVLTSRKAKLSVHGNPTFMGAEGASESSFYKVMKVLRAPCVLDCFSPSASPRGSQGQ